MSKLVPNGWLQTTLGKIAKPSSDRIVPSQATTLPYIGLEHIESDTMKLVGKASAADAKSASLQFMKGDVLYGKMRPYLNKVWLAEFDGLCSAEFLVFPSYDGLNSKYLAYVLNSEDFVAFAESHTSGERPRVNFDKLAEFAVALPPEREQARIVSQISSIFATLSKADAASVRARARLAKYRASVLSYAVTGKLTAHWRTNQSATETGLTLRNRLVKARRVEWSTAKIEQHQIKVALHDNKRVSSVYREPVQPREDALPIIPDTWAWASLDQLGELNRGRSKHRPRGDARLYDGPYPFIQTGDIRRSEGTITSHTQTYNDFGLAQSRIWPAGTLCITISANIAETGILSYPACFPDSVVGLCHESGLVNLRFIEYFIRSRKLELEKYAPATAQKNLTLEFLAALAVPLPPFAEQNKIVALVEQKLQVANQLDATIDRQLSRSRKVRSLLIVEALSGKLLPQNSSDESARLAEAPLKRDKTSTKQLNDVSAKKTEKFAEPEETPMKRVKLSQALLDRAFKRLGNEATAEELFIESGCRADQVAEFYSVLKAAPQLRRFFERENEYIAKPDSTTDNVRDLPSIGASSGGHFRLVNLWLEEFKNLKDYTASFESTHGLDVIMGWNGTGKSNLFEALVIIFRDLHDWVDRNRWPDEPLKGFTVIYEINDQRIRVEWAPQEFKRPKITASRLGANIKGPAKKLARIKLPLPRFVFGYYSGPTNRLAEHFAPMNLAHYARLRDATSDDPATLAGLLEQRRFFCAETHHAKYVLLAFCHKEDKDISEFLRSRLRIEGFASALFVIRKPRWAKQGSSADDFWGATGVMRRVLERLRDFALAPMVVEQLITDGYRTAKEDHYYFYLPDLAKLHAFAAEYDDARTFFLALESTDFSELIYDLKIQVRVCTTDKNTATITFKEMSEGEQQLLMVLGLLRFTKSAQSLVLLDEPDTHLNPHWSVDYLRLLASIMQDDTGTSAEQQTSQILISTHDPLVIASLVKEQVHLMKRIKSSGEYQWVAPSVDPKGLGFTGILTSEMFGFRSDLDADTLADLDDKVRLMAKDGALLPKEEERLEAIDLRLSKAGFKRAFSDPYYAAFVRAWGRQHDGLMRGQHSLSDSERVSIDEIADRLLEEAFAEVSKGASKE